MRSQGAREASVFKKIMGMFGGSKGPAVSEGSEVSKWASYGEAEWKDLFAGLVQAGDLEEVYKHILLCPLHWSVGLLGFLQQSSFQPADPSDQATYSKLCNLSPAPDWPLMIPQPVQVGSLSHRGKGVSLIFSTDGQNLVTIDAGGDINVWHAPDERTLQRIQPTAPVPVESRTVSPDFKFCTTSSQDAIRVWNLHTGDLVSKFRWEWSEGTSPAILSSPADSVIACWFSDDKIRLIEPLSGEIRHTLTGHDDLVTSCAFTADGKLLISGGKDASVRIWDVETGQMLHFLERRTGGEAVTHVSLSLDGKFLLVKRENSPLQIFDPPTRRQVCEVRMGKGVDMATPVYSPTHDTVALVLLKAQEDKESQMRVAIYEMATGRQIRDLPPTYLNFPSPVYSADGEFLAATGADHAVLWPVKGNGQDAVCKREAWTMAFAPNGQIMAAGERDKRIRLFSMPETREVADLGSWQQCRYLSFSPDSGILAAVGDDRSVRVFRVALTQPMALMGKREVDLAKKYSATVEGEPGKAWSYLGEVLAARTRKPA